MLPYLAHTGAPMFLIRVDQLKYPKMHVDHKINTYLLLMNQVTSITYLFITVFMISLVNGYSVILG